MYYQIKETLEETSLEKCIEQMGEIPYVAILSPDDWLIHKDSFDMGFDIDPNPKSIYNTKAEVNYDSITGTFCIPHRHHRQPFRRPAQPPVFPQKEMAVTKGAGRAW